MTTAPDPERESSWKNTESLSCVTITVKRNEPKHTQKKCTETSSPEPNSEASQSFREAMEEFLRRRTDFKKRGRGISAVLPQGSPAREDPGREEDAS